MFFDAPDMPMAPNDTTEHEYLLPIEASAHAPALARRFLAEHAQRFPVDLIQDALLLATELVTNAIRYGGPEITLRIYTGPPGVDVAVDDSGAELPGAFSGPPDPAQQGGRGLVLVNALASAWGVMKSDPPPGKTVWCALRLPA